MALEMEIMMERIVLVLTIRSASILVAISLTAVNEVAIIQLIVLEIVQEFVHQLYTVVLNAVALVCIEFVCSAFDYTIVTQVVNCRIYLYSIAAVRVTFLHYIFS